MNRFNLLLMDSAAEAGESYDYDFARNMLRSIVYVHWSGVSCNPGYKYCFLEPDSLPLIKNFASPTKRS